MDKLQFVPLPEIRKVQNNVKDSIKRAQILADIFRINTLYMIMNAGSGHPGTCFSCMDIATWLWTEEMTNPNDREKDGHDIFFSSKGHDVPAIYSILIGLGKLDFDNIHKLRRLHGLPGHPDIGTPFIAANTGSLGMGISKAKGLAYANRLSGKSGKIYVLTGDGELQEGQIWESLGSAANNKFSEIIVIVDNNKIQSDLYVKDTSDLGDLENKFRSFGWEVARCGGHDFHALEKVFSHFKTVKDKPQVLIADTLKGKGVTLMEQMSEDGFYKFHSGAPSAEVYKSALKELVGRVNSALDEAGEGELNLESKEAPEKHPLLNTEKLVVSYSDELVKIARENKNIVALNADLVLDCGLVPFKKEFPDRFIECGIAEQDMVSVAGGLALKGKLPIAHSFACFLSTRPNEQIYNNATEKTKIIYTATLAGLLPATPGHSHQSVRDISALGAVPGLIMIQPSNEEETRAALNWAVKENKKNTYLRLISIQCEKLFDLPDGYKLEVGKGAFIKKGDDAAIIAYGPLMLGEAVKAARILSKMGISLSVINLPWLNRIDKEWLKDAVSKYKTIFTLDDHYIQFGQGMMIRSALAENGSSGQEVIKFGVREIPESGQNTEVLKYHKLDFESLAKSIETHLGEQDSNSHQVEKHENGRFQGATTKM